VPLVGNIIGPMHTAGHSNQLERSFKRQTKEKLPAVVNKLITKATADLEKQKKKVLKKMDALIETRNQEVAEAKEAIVTMESAIEGLKEKNKHLKEKSNQEINKLQEGIRELNEQLKDYQKEKEEAENFFKKQREARLKKEMDGQININSPIQDPQAKIEKLEKDIDDLEMELKIVRSDRDLTKGEVKNLKSELEREVNL